jgi:hypothetical protein
MSTRVQVSAGPPRRPVATAPLQRCGRSPCPPGACQEDGASALLRSPSAPLAADLAPDAVQQALDRPGQPLDRQARALLEPRFGVDFSRVRVHADATAAESARRVNALAYTVGHDIVFGAGRYAPSTAGGRWLLAHELAHVVQQSGLPDRGPAVDPGQDLGAAPQRQPVSTPVGGEELEEEGGTGPSTIESETDETLPEEEEQPSVPQAYAVARVHGTPTALGEGPARLEHEADLAADSVLLGRHAAVRGSAAGLGTWQPRLQRKDVCGRPSKRVADYPSTYVDQIGVDLTSPDHPVTLTWAGPNKASGDTGPFHSSPGAGKCNVNCDDTATSQTAGTLCTPKGSHKVTSNGKCALGGHPEAEYPTYFQREGIALHSYPSVPNHPASHGCVRLDLGPAQLIHENSVRETTMVNVTGTWTRCTKTVKGKPTPVCYS